jgi:hypothetical protein
MSKYDCNNLTKAIQKLANLNVRVDLSLSKFESSDGMAAQQEASKIIEKNRPFALLGKKAYEYFLKVFGNEEEINKRIFTIEATGISGVELVSEMEAMGVNVWDDAKELFLSPNFVPSKKGEKIVMMQITLDELEPNWNYVKWSQIINSLERLGIDPFLPHETAANIILNKIPKEYDSSTSVLTTPVPFGNSFTIDNRTLVDSDLFYIGTYTETEAFIRDGGYAFGDGKLTDHSHFIFCLKKFKGKK